MQATPTASPALITKTMKTIHKLTTIAATLLLLGSTTAATAQEKTPAFPGAEGFGRYVTGGRGGEVCYVTRNDDCSDSNLVPQFKDFGNSRPVGQWGWIARDWDQTSSAFRIVGYTLTIPAGSTVTLNTHFSVTAPGQGSGTVENEKPQM